MSNWLSKKEFAKELGVTIGNLNQILVRGPKDRKFPKPGSQYVKKQGKQNRYSPEYVSLVKGSRKGAGHSKSLLTASVAIYDKAVADLLLKRFKNAEAIEAFLREKLVELYKPTLDKLAKLDAEYEKKRKEALEG